MHRCQQCPKQSWQEPSSEEAAHVLDGMWARLVEAEHRPRAFEVVAAQLQLSHCVHCRCACSRSAKSGYLLNTTHHSRLLICNVLSCRGQFLAYTRTRADADQAPAQGGGECIKKGALHKRLTICDVKLNRGPLGHLGQPDIQVLLLARLREQHAAAALFHTAPAPWRTSGAYIRCITGSYREIFAQCAPPTSIENDLLALCLSWEQAWGLYSSTQTGTHRRCSRSTTASDQNEAWCPHLHVGHLVQDSPVRLGVQFGVLLTMRQQLRQVQQQVPKPVQQALALSTVCCTLKDHENKSSSTAAKLSGTK